MHGRGPLAETTVDCYRDGFEKFQHGLIHYLLVVRVLDWRVLQVGILTLLHLKSASSDLVVDIGRGRP